LAATLRDVALKAGVSIKTVSRVVNHQGEISETTRQRVYESFFPEVARGVLDTAEPLGYNVFLCNSDGDFQREIHTLESLLDHGVDGIIIFLARRVFCRSRAPATRAGLSRDHGRTRFAGRG
jgi:LacI family transcriptional regulator